MALCGWCFLKIVRQDKVVALRYVNSAGRTTSFVPVSVEEHGFTLIAEPPMALCGWCFLKIVRQDKIVALRYVGSASRTAPLTRVSIEEHRFTLIAEAPIRLIIRSGSG